MKSRITIFLLLLFVATGSYANQALDAAVAQFEARDTEAAIDALEKLAKDNDRDALLHLTRAQLRSGDTKGSLKTIERFIDEYPNDADAHYIYGLVHLTLMGEVSMFKMVSMARKAKAGWEKAVELDPQHLDARYAIFSYYVNAPKIGGGDIEQAKVHQQQIAELDEGYGTLAKGVLLIKEEKIEEAEAAFVKTVELRDTAGSHFGLAQFYLQQEMYQKALDAIPAFFTKPRELWDPDLPVGHLLTARAYAGLGNTEAARAAAETGMSLKPNKRIKELFTETLEDL